MPTVDEEGPPYPDLGAGVAKFRRRALSGLAVMEPVDRRAYGEAVERAIKSKQRSELLGGGAAPAPVIRDMGAHLRAKHRAELMAHVVSVRRKRTPDQWLAMYEEAMNANKAGKQSAVPEKLERDPRPNPNARRTRRKQLAVL